ncbi:PAS domain S-box protein [Sulfurimonas sp.]|uniref:PAS domain S-box protein n=1 Tax=Sulfurimonas sp. TaxID=2022749 RepID=UPI003569D0B0
MHIGDKFKNSIKTKVVFQVTTLIAFILILATSFILYLDVTSLQEKAELNLKNKAKELADGVEQMLGYLQENTELLANNELFINALIDEKEKNKYLLPLINNFKNAKFLNSLSVVDFDGRVVFKTADEILGFNQSDELRLSLNLGQTVAYIKAQTREIVFIVPIKYYATTQGAIVATYDINKIIQKYNQNEEFIYTKFFKNSLEYYKNNYQKNKDYYTYEFQVQDAGNYHLLSNLGTRVEMGMLEDVYIEPLKKEIVILVIFGVLILAVGMIISYFLATAITDPILKLYKAVNLISSKDEIDEYQPLGTKDELEVLGYAFYKKTKELEKLNQTLDAKVQHAIKEQNTLLSLFDKGDLVLFKWKNDKNWNVEYVSQSVEKLLGYTQDEFLNGKINYAYCIHKDDLHQVIDEVANEINVEGLYKHTPYRVITKEGDEKWILDYTSAVKDEDGNITHFIGYISDISSTKNLEIALREQINFNRSLVESANSIIAVIDRNGVMIDINPYGEQFTGYTKAQIASKPFFWDRFLPEDIQKKVITIIDNAKKGQVTHHFRNAWISKNGIKKTFEWSNAAIKDENGDLKYLTTIGVDVTDMITYQIDLEKAKLEAEKANMAKSEFLANMSHEIRTPLNGVIGLTELALQTELDERQRDYLEKAETSSKALLHIINDVLDYSKIEAGKLSLEKNTFELERVIKNLVDLFEYQANKKGLLLNINIKNKLTLEGDALRLTQVLTNIVGNAIKFTNKGSIDMSIQITEEDTHSVKLKFSIKDSGMGMNKEIQNNLFKEFTQADNSITRKYGGTGLGLSISKHLVEMMGGEIWVESKEGEGSTFTFSSVFEKADDKTADKKNSDKQVYRSNSTIEGAHLLLVEDNIINQIVAVGILEEFNITVDIANNGKEAVEMIEAGDEYDLILMDLQMPVMDGFEASRHIKQINENIPIIALSAAVMEEDMTKTREARMSAHLAKPIEKDELFRVLSQYIKPKKLNTDVLKREESADHSIQFYGIDLEELKHRIGEKPKIIKQMVLNFCRQYEDVEVLFDISKIDSDEFESAIHSLKGVSGNLALKEVYLLAKEIHDASDVEIREELTTRLIALLKNTVENLKIQLEKVDDTVSDKEYKKEDVLKYIKDMEKNIRHFRVITQDKIKQLEEMLVRYVDEKTVKELSSYLLAYKYKDADKLLNEICKLLGN